MSFSDTNLTDHNQYLKTNWPKLIIIFESGHAVVPQHDGQTNKDGLNKLRFINRFVMKG